jgi:eukaryotic-like serine/threonine-protein kinase
MPAVSTMFENNESTDPVDPTVSSIMPESFPSSDPTKIGRYRVIRLLGKGGFGRVYLAQDDELDRAVAIKVPNFERIAAPEDLKSYLTEAKILAHLDHPNIVPVYDAGRADDGICYVVSKFLQGSDLKERILQGRPPFPESADLVAVVADALHYAHTKGLVHRDVKPANILLDERGKPCVADFGLALRDEDFGKNPGMAGTPVYMSPEQARGEGHRVDGRSDIFSLGVVFYELLTARRPFKADSIADLVDQIKSADPRPPRQVDDTIPKELERICLKALAKRAADRYTTARDMAEDLHDFVKTVPAGLSAAPVVTTPRPDSAPEVISPVSPPAHTDSNQRPIKIVPKGLRSFDEHDADFFLELLPGARNRDGLPDSIRFWKMQIETIDPGKTFRVGLILGPSGCGKSSLLKAGLLPRLAANVISVHIEATADETEQRLLNRLKKACPALPDRAGLVDSLAAVRKGRVLGAGRKLLLVIDQFEQWLHARRGEEESELTGALRQCDGEHVQAIVLVRDDFWLAVTRFLKDLEINQIQGHNTAVVDLFDTRHATKVLTAFGAAFGNLPENGKEITKEQRQFLDQATAELAENGKVVSVRLALFAEMMKGKAWTPAALREVGGAAGVGVTFLEETFISPHANPLHRMHQNAARAVLKALLPDSGTDIKGQMRSEQELQAAAGNAARPRDFHEVLHILDGELRLITPTDPEGSGSEQTATAPVGRYYQLTHDYLVPSLREWLTRKQRETRRGRAELRLAERSSLWNAKPESRHLPSLLEWLRIRVLTDSTHWTEPQQKMMRQAARTHGWRSALALAGMIAVVTAGIVLRNQVAARQEATRVEGLVGRLVSAEPSQVPDIVKQLDARPGVAMPLLSSLVAGKAETPDARRAQLHARLAMVSRDPSQVEPLVEELLTGKETYVLPIRALLRPRAARLTERFRGLLRDDKSNTQGRFRAALALADFIPASEQAWWTVPDLQFVAGQLVSSNAEYQPLLREALRPIRARLVGDLEHLFADARGATPAQRLGAANALADFAGSDIPRLTGLLAVATPEQFDVLYPLVAAGRSPAVVEQLSQLAATQPAEALGSVERVQFGQRRAGAAVTLLRLGERKKVLPVFEVSDDPEALTQFIFRCRPCGVGVDALLDCLDRLSNDPPNRDPSDARYALILTLGEFALPEIPKSRRDALIKQLANWYRDDKSSGVHGAAGWLLRRWGQSDIVREVDQTPIPYSPDREWFTLGVTVKPKPGAAAKPLPPKTLYFTFVVFPAGDSRIGSADDEPERQKNEVRHPVRLTRPFALLDREITLEELIAFDPKYAGFMQQVDAKPEASGFAADWYDSAGFCRWLGQQMGLPESDQPYADPATVDKAKYPHEPNPSASWAPRNWPLEPGRRELRPGRRGQFDLHGNVWEWTHDWFERYDTNLATDPHGPDGGSYRVSRGGGWPGDAVFCRAAIRDTDAPTTRTIANGFRLALIPAGSVPEAKKGERAEPSGGRP